MALHARRLTLGPHESEGARLLWEQCDIAGTIGAVAKRLGFRSDEMSRLIYCDYPANLSQANRCFEVLNIPQTAWESKPTKPIVLPGIQAAQRALSASTAVSAP